MLSSGICDEVDEDDDVVVVAVTGGMPAPKKCGKIVLRVAIKCGVFFSIEKSGKIHLSIWEKLPNHEPIISASE